MVHITTPAESHYDIARYCLEQGCHVYVEKPLRSMRSKRSVSWPWPKKGVKLTVGHNDQFSHVARRMRALVQSGYLGGPPVHMESYYSYDLAIPGTPRRY